MPSNKITLASVILTERSVQNKLKPRQDFHNPNCLWRIHIRVSRWFICNTVWNGDLFAVIKEELDDFRNIAKSTSMSQQSLTIITSLQDSSSLVLRCTIEVLKHILNGNFKSHFEHNLCMFALCYMIVLKRHIFLLFMNKHIHFM